MFLLSSRCPVDTSLREAGSAVRCPELSTSLGWVMASQDDVGNRRGGPVIRKRGRDGLHVHGLIESGRRRRKRGGTLDLRRIIFQPLGVIEGDGGNDAAPAAVGGGKAALLDGALSNDDLVAKRTNAYGLDVDAELVGPEGR